MKKSYILYIISILLMILYTNLSIILNIPYFRQLTSFILLMFVPGVLLIQILKLDDRDTLEKILLCVGLSLISVIFLGALVNSLIPTSRPLKTSNLLIIFDIILLSLLFLGHGVNRNSPFKLNFSKIKFNSYEKIALIFLVLLPVFSIVGTYLIKYSHNYIFLYILVFLIPLLIIYLSFLNKKSSEDTYIIAIFSIAISLILAYTLISNYIYGSDSHQEFYFFEMVLSTGKWQIFGNTTLDSCLSISLLPAVYELFLGTDPTFLFKSLYVLPLSLIPLVVYKISRNYNNKLYSFLTAIFIISVQAFYSQTEAYRTYLAVFFFALVIMVLLMPYLNDMKRKILFIVFSIGIIVSHYSTTYIYTILILVALVILYLLKFLKKIEVNYVLKKRGVVSKDFFKNKGKFLDIGLFVLIFAIMFLWYSQITGATFSQGMYFISNTLGKFNQLFLAETRDPTIYQSAGITLSNAPLVRYINFFSSWAAVISIFIGLLVTAFSIFKIKTFLSGSHSKLKVNEEFFSLSLASVLVMIFAVIIPFTSVFYSLPRLYYMLIVILSVFFVLGVKSLSNLLKIKRAYILILIILTPMLLSSIGITPQFFGTPNSILLNPDQKINHTFYIHDQEANSVKWFVNYRDPTEKVYTDTRAAEAFISVGLIPKTDMGLINYQRGKGYTYLSYSDIFQGKLTFWRYADVWDVYDIKKFSGTFNKENLIYDDGYCEFLRY